MAAQKIKKGDRVVVLSGKDKGKHGEVTKAMPKEGKVIVSGVNVATRHRKASQANPTPATDGKHVVAFFASEGLHCYDVDGKFLWKSDLGVLNSGWFYDKAQAGGGVLADLGIYHLTSIATLFGPAARFTASLTTRFANRHSWSSASSSSLGGCHSGSGSCWRRSA